MKTLIRHFLVVIFFQVCAVNANRASKATMDKWQSLYRRAVVGAVLNDDHIKEYLSPVVSDDDERVERVHDIIKELDLVASEEDLSIAQIKERLKLLLPETNVPPLGQLKSILKSFLSSKDATFKSQSTQELQTLGQKLSKQLDAIAVVDNKDGFKQISAVLDDMASLDVFDAEELADIQSLQRINAYYLMDNVKERLLNKFEKKLTMLKQGGAINLSADVQVGYGVNATTIKLGLIGTLSIAINDDRSIMEDANLSLSLTASAGISPVTAELSVKAGTSKGRLFFGIRDWLLFHMDDLLPALLSQSRLSNLSFSFDDGFRLDKAIWNEQNNVLTRLRARGVIGTSEQLLLRPAFRPLFLDTNKVNISLKGGISAIVIGGSIEESLVKAVYKSKISLLLSLIRLMPNSDEDTELYDLLSRKKKTIMIEAVAGDDEVKQDWPWLNARYNEIIKLTKLRYQKQVEGSKATRELKVINAQLQKLVQDIVYDMDALHKQFQVYTAIAQARDADQEGAGSVKHRLEKARNTKGRVDTVKSFIHSHAFLLLQLYKIRYGSFIKLSDAVLNRLKVYEQSYQSPNLDLSSSERAQLNKLVKAHSEIFMITASLIVGTKEVKATLYNTVMDPNPDNTGVVLNITMPRELLVSQRLFASAIARLGNHLESDDAIATAYQINKSVLKVLYDGTVITNSGFSLGTIGNLGYSTEAVLSFAVHPLTNKWVYRYSRLNDSVTVGARLQDVPVGYGVQVGAGLTLQAAQVVEEVIGTNTLYYLWTVYNGFRLGYGDDADNVGWRWFKEKHAQEITTICQGLADGSESLLAEVQAVLDNVHMPEREAKEMIQAIQSGATTQGTLAVVEKVLDVNYVKFFKPTYSGSFQRK